MKAMLFFISILLFIPFLMYKISDDNLPNVKKKFPEEKEIPIKKLAQQNALCDAQLRKKKSYLYTKERKDYIDKKRDLESIFEERNLMFSKIIATKNNNANNWKGEIKSFTVLDEGVLVFVKLLCVSDDPDSKVILMNPATTSLIKNNSSVYNNLRRYHVGDHISFSGNFIRSDNINFDEGSFTRSGSIDYPEFRFEFSYIGGI